MPAPIYMPEQQGNKSDDMMQQMMMNLFMQKYQFGLKEKAAQKQMELAKIQQGSDRLYEETKWKKQEDYKAQTKARQDQQKADRDYQIANRAQAMELFEKGGKLIQSMPRGTNQTPSSNSVDLGKSGVWSRPPEDRANLQLVETAEGLRNYDPTNSAGTLSPVIGKPPEDDSGVSVTTNVDLGNKAMMKLGEEMAKSTVTQHSEVSKTADSLRLLEDTTSFLDEGVITGFGAEYILGFGKMLQQLGYNKHSDAIANTEAFASLMGNQVGEVIKQFGAGTGLSDADREYAEKMVGGKITLTEKSIRKIVAINKKARRNVIKSYNRKATQIMSKKGAEDLLYDLIVKLPEEKTDADRAADEIIRKARASRNQRMGQGQ